MEDESFRQGRESAPIDNTGAPYSAMTLEGFGQPPLHLSVCLSARDVIALTDYMHAIVAAEREACAKVCEAERVEIIGAGDDAYNIALQHAAAAIRSRTTYTPQPQEPPRSGT